MSPRAAARLESLGFSRIYDYVAGKDDWIANGLPLAGADASQTRAGDLAAEDVPRCSIGEHTDTVLERMEQAGWAICAIVNDDQVVLGLLSKSAVEANPESDVEKIMEIGPSTYRPGASPRPMLRYMERHDTDQMLVTTSNGRLVGAVRREAAQQAIDQD